VTQVQIAKVWLVLSLVLLYYALNSWLVSQGGNEIFGVKLIVSNQVPAAMIAIPICGVLLICTSWIGRLHAVRGGDLWHRRIPIVGFESIDTASKEGRLYQGFMLVVFSLLPILAMLHFWRIFWSAEVMLSDTKAFTTIWDWSAMTVPARICTHHQVAEEICAGNATILPGLEPLIFAAISVAALVLAVLHWFEVFRKSA